VVIDIPDDLPLVDDRAEAVKAVAEVDDLRNGLRRRIKIDNTERCDD